MGSWQTIDLRSDPDIVELRGDPAELPNLAELVEELVHRPAWMADASCREHPELDYYSATSAALAIEVCTGCLVRTECLTFALERHEAGVWGGTTDDQRSGAADQRPRCIDCGGPCRGTRCRACFDAMVAAQLAAAS